MDTDPSLSSSLDIPSSIFMNPSGNPPNPSTSSPRPSTVSATNQSTSFDGGTRRFTKFKESQFVHKYGQRLHSFDPEKAPYPLSYDRPVLELESLDNHFTKQLRKGSMTFLNLKDAPAPRYCLDLGCGTGTWVIDAASEWPQCEFVGFDLVNVQIPLRLLPRTISERIRWIHGNFLTTKLPFDDDEFDHIHVQSIASGVPETKWSVLFDEINRVLRPGGSIEFIEDDMIFPSLPRWFTASLRVRRQSTSVHLPDGTLRGRNFSFQADSLSHDHALLESLYNSVFEHRFINTKPCGLLPSYFATYFRHITLGPIISFPMPLLSPLPPLPPQLATAYAIEPVISDGPPDYRSSMAVSSTSSGRPSSLSFSSTLSSVGTSTKSEQTDSISSPMSPQQETNGASSSSASCNKSLPSVPNGDSISESPDETGPQLPPKLYCLDSSLVRSASDILPPLLISSDQLDRLNERSLAMHLYRSFHLVLGCQEAIWEELKDRIRNRKEELKPFGWEDDEDLEELQNRKKFERLIERYRTDMNVRLSLWSSLLDMGWALPVREPLSKAELIEEERLREAMLKARKYASPEDLYQASRSFRVLVGYKP